MDTALFPVVTDADLRLPLYLTSVGHWTHQDPVHRAEGFPDFQWLQVLSGEGQLTVGSRRMTVKAGQGMCLYPNVPHRYEASKSPWGLYWVSFSGELAEPLLREAGIGECGVFGTVRPELAVAHLRGLYELASSSGGSFAGREFSKRLYAMLLDVRGVLEGFGADGQQMARLAPVLRLIDEQMHRSLTLAEMADAAGTSPQHLCALFRQALEMRPVEYLNRERIKRSKELMFRESGLPIREIARRVGFDHASYFGAVFKRLEGQSPERFKMMHGLKS
ncbi:AraC family transcriptional regulator [Cohnella caldifontis]|uniref:AraC family transcriptional regulator n=1 Tax=Cohnella caldifontis TaxID=3027471 RepID=UPI0023EE11DC|nr:AraC family transcriptional regulator [Cohnella sp. YIM B05605]